MEALLVDLDGVVYEGATPVAGASAAIDWLRSRKIAHLFLTNTKRFGIDNDLMQFIGSRHTGHTLYCALTSGHFAGFIICHVTLNFGSTL